MSLLRVGLTGGIASGKSTVARLLEWEHGVPVLDVDRLARELVEPGQPGLERLVERLGPGILDPGGRLDRELLRRRAAREEGLRRQLEEVLHPLLAREVERWLAGREAEGRQAAVVEVPLLVEAGWQDRFDRVLVVDCPPELQLRRLVERRGLPPEEARRWLGTQASREQRLAVADELVRNAAGLDELRAELRRAWRALLRRGRV